MAVFEANRVCRARSVISDFAKIWYEHSRETTFYENQHIKLKIPRTLKIQIPRMGRIPRTAGSPEYMDQASGWVGCAQSTFTRPTPPELPETDTTTGHQSTETDNRIDCVSFVDP